MSPDRFARLLCLALIAFLWIAVIVGTVHAVVSIMNVINTSKQIEQFEEGSK